ncbi:MAG: hypothetical protein IKE43_06595 [Coriobacteriales bacterium]|nr:hypothetical protein [Coriobacteriales bacterium]
MAELKEVVLQLLDEIDLATVASGIPYSLIGLLYRDACVLGQLEDAQYDAAIAIPSQGRDAFLKALGSLGVAHREIMNNYTSSAIIPADYYIASNTTVIDFSTLYAPGVYGANIRILSFDCNNTKSELINPNTGQIVPFEGNYFASMARVVVDKHTYMVSRGETRVLFERLGESWRSVTWPYRISKGNRMGTIIEVDMPYREFFEGVPMKCGFDKETNIKWSRLKELLETDLVAAKDEMSIYDRIFERTEHRYRLYLKYMPHKERILNAWREGRYDLVAKTLQDYTQKLKDHYESTGVTLYFDREFFDIAVSILTMSKYKYAKKLEAAIPESHKLPLAFE